MLLYIRTFRTVQIIQELLFSKVLLQKQPQVSNNLLIYLFVVLRRVQQPGSYCDG